MMHRFLRENLRRFLAALLVLASIGMGFLAYAIRATDAAMRVGDRRFTIAISRSPYVDEDLLSGSTSGEARQLQWALGLTDDGRFRDAIVAFLHFVSDPSQRTFEESRSALRHIVISDPDPMRRSYAANLLGLLAVSQVETFDEENPFVQEAFWAFRTALRSNPMHEEARFNLELLWWLVITREQEKGRTAGPNSDIGEGAGFTSPGGGY